MPLRRQDLAFALVTEALALATLNPGWLTLWLATVASVGPSLAAIGNSLRLRSSRAPIVRRRESNTGLAPNHRTTAGELDPPSTRTGQLHY